MSLDTMTREEIEAELTPLGKKLSEAITGDGEGLTEDEKDRWGVLHKAWVATKRSRSGSRSGRCQLSSRPSRG